jgi:hypothetical protein
MSKKPDEARPRVEPPSTPPGIVQPMIDELRGRPPKPQEDLKAPPRGPLHPPEPEELEPAGSQPAESELDAGAGGTHVQDHSNPTTKH